MKVTSIQPLILKVFNILNVKDVWRVNVLIERTKSLLIYYLGKEVGQEEDTEWEPQDRERFEEDEHIKEENEDVWPQDGEFEVANIVVRRVMITKALDDPSQRENPFEIS